MSVGADVGSGDVEVDDVGKLEGAVVGENVGAFVGAAVGVDVGLSVSHPEPDPDPDPDPESSSLPQPTDPTLRRSRKRACRGGDVWEGERHLHLRI